MPLSQSEVDHFHAFASWMVENRDVESLDVCLKEFRKEQDATVEAIEEGLADVEAGRTRPFEEFMAELRSELNRPPQVPAS